MTPNAPVHVTEIEWVPFAGGELEGKRPKALCAACRSRFAREAKDRFRVSEPITAAPGTEHPSGVLRAPLCFECYRADLARERALKAAGDLDTASAERFQAALPLEPVNHPRLARLKVARKAARASHVASSPYVDRRRQAQIKARHVLQRLADGLRAHRAAPQFLGAAGALRRDQLQLPEAWLPFVAAR